MNKTNATGNIPAAETRQLDRDAIVSPEERAQLARMANEMPDGDDQVLHRASLDETDEDGTPLEEKGLDQDLSGEDLDVPGAEDDDADDIIPDNDTIPDNDAE